MIAASCFAGIVALTSRAVVAVPFPQFFPPPEYGANNQFQSSPLCHNCGYSTIGVCAQCAAYRQPISPVYYGVAPLPPIQAPVGGFAKPSPAPKTRYVKQAISNPQNDFLPSKSASAGVKGQGGITGCFGKSCYAIHIKASTQQQAADACRDDKAKLAYVDDGQLIQNLFDLIHARNFSEHESILLWIGLSRQKTYCGFSWFGGAAKQNPKCEAVSDDIHSWNSADEPARGEDTNCVVLAYKKYFADNRPPGDFDDVHGKFTGNECVPEEVENTAVPKESWIYGYVCETPNISGKQTRLSSRPLTTSTAMTTTTVPLTSTASVDSGTRTNTGRIWPDGTVNFYIEKLSDRQTQLFKRTLKNLADRLNEVGSGTSCFKFLALTTVNPSWENHVIVKKPDDESCQTELAGLRQGTGAQIFLYGKQCDTKSKLTTEILRLLGLNLPIDTQPTVDEPPTDAQIEQIRKRYSCPS